MTLMQLLVSLVSSQDEAEPSSPHALAVVLVVLGKASRNILGKQNNRQNRSYYSKPAEPMHEVAGFLFPLSIETRLRRKCLE